ncbi:hypothetical protein GCM10028791_42780 [Echinicola sediminis]
MKKRIKEIIFLMLSPFRFILFEVNKQAEKELDVAKKNKILSKVRDCGKGVKINGNIIITHPEFLVLGNNVHIGDGTYIHSDGGILVGDNTHISRNVVIYTSNHNYEGTALPYDDKRIYKSVKISENVWIGMNVCICPGVTIGEGAIIGLGAVVSKDVPPFSIIGSGPQRILKERNGERYRLLKDSKKYGGVNGCLITESSKILQGKSVFNLGPNLFFILSTGRSGSQSIARTLSQHPDVTCLHEAKPELIRLSTDYAHGIISREQVKKEIVKIYSSTTNIFTPYYGESDQKLSNLVEVLREIFPQAKFIWLLRNAKDVITSTYSRGWFDDVEYGFTNDFRARFTGGIYSAYRLNGGKVNGILSENDWEKMSAFERNCWYWSYWNNLISKSFEEIANGKKLTIKLEEFSQGLYDINHLLGLSDYDYQIKIFNKAKYDLKTQWSKKQRDYYNSHCLPLMNEWYG